MPEFRTLPCPLSDAEVAERAHTMAKLVAEEQAVEVQKKAAADEFKERLEHIGGNIRRLARQVRERSEDRAIEVDFQHDDVRFAVDTIRLDTGEIIGSRPMTEDEKKEAIQGRLPGIGKRSRGGQA